METNALEHDTLVAVVGGLEGTVDRDVEVLGLLIGESGELDVELGEMSAGNFFIEFLWQHMNTKGEITSPCPEGDLSKYLVSERARHHKGRVPSGTSKQPVLAW